MSADSGRCVVVRGNPAPEELAAVLAVVAESSGGVPPRDGLAAWRAGRVAALARSAASRE
ncbi:MAG: acyl-CoA carboxylase subunit epsilon [Jatrophihabitans sp.]